MYIIKKTTLSLILLIVAVFTFSQSITDYEGNEYQIIEIGEQIWMAKNLNSIFDSNGDSIASYCFYNNSNYCKRYGRLYPWASLKISGTDDIQQGICPEGWHIPSDDEWNIMIELLGGLEEAGKKLKNEEYPVFNIQYGGNYNTVVKIFSYIDDHSYF